MHRQTLEAPKFQTDLIPINIQILQSVLYSAEKQIPRVKLYLQFDDQAKYKNFMNKLTPTLDQDEDILMNSDSEISSDENENVDSQSENQISTIKQILYEQKLSRLELSIILKEYYKETISNIMKQTGTRILIVPQKIKFFGYSQQTIEEAKSLVHEIKIKIIVSCLEKFGKQAYESKFMREKLKKCGIELGRVAEKYYYWYQFDEKKEKIIKEVLSQLFNKSAHVFYPLIENYELLRRKLNTKYIDALIKTRALLYQKYLNNEINEDKHQLNAELNEEKTEIIIHIPVRQQSQTLIYEIKRFYSQFVHFFIHYKVDQNEEIQNIAEIEKKLEEKNLKWFRHEELIVLNFQKTNHARPQESSNSFDEYNQSRDTDFLLGLKQVFELNLNFYIEYLGEQQKKMDQGEEKNIPLLKKITKQYKLYDGLCVISPKTQLVHLYLQIVDYFILKPLVCQDKEKKKEQTSVVNQNVEFSNNMLHDTTVQNEQSSLDQSQVQANGNTRVVGQDSKVFILSELKQNVEFEGYNFYFKDILGQNKYQCVDSISRGKPLAEEVREVLEEQLQSATNRKYQIYKVSIPEKQKVNLPSSQDIVTVFVKDSEKQCLLKEKVSVHLLNKSRAVCVNGWLLNVSKANIRDINNNNNKYEIENRQFQIIAYLKYIEG